MSATHPSARQVPGGLVDVGVCPACASPDRTSIFASWDWIHRVPGSFVLQRCSNCASVYPDPRPDDATLPAYYPRQELHPPHPHMGLRSKERPLVGGEDERSAPCPDRRRHHARGLSGIGDVLDDIGALDGVEGAFRPDLLLEHARDQRGLGHDPMVLAALGGDQETGQVWIDTNDLIKALREMGQPAS